MGVIMRQLQANIVGDLANGNTLNISIIAALAVFVIIMIYVYFRHGGKFKAGNIEIGNTSVGVPVQRIDDTCKLKCRESLNGMREIVLAELPINNKIICEAIVDRILNPLYSSIARNHFTKTFSDKEKNSMWIKRIHDDIIRNIKVVEWHCDTEWPELHTPEFDTYILSLVEHCRQLFIDPIVEGCYAKIETYEKLQAESTKDWIEKNHDYIKTLRNL
jgi:hypothetical protein